MKVIKVTDMYGIYRLNSLNYQIAEWVEEKLVTPVARNKEPYMKEAHWSLKESYHPNIEQAVSKIVRFMVLDSADKEELDDILDVIKEMNAIHDKIIKCVLPCLNVV